MEINFNELLDEALDDINGTNDLKALSDIKIKWLGKKSKLTLSAKYIKTISNVNDRKIVGKKINDVRNTIDNAILSKASSLLSDEQKKIFSSEEIDITIPGKKNNIGRLHPLSIVLNEIEDIFIAMGYSVVEAHDIETTYYNFDALNIPVGHAARDAHDTFYISRDEVLITATSPMQIRIMETTKPPIKIVSPGRVYRIDQIDSTHLPMFHQLEGLVVNKNISMSDLKGTLYNFVKELIGKDIKVRFRPHYFPFTEPSAELDVECFICHGKGCKVCKFTGFIELLGCGMVHPKVLEQSGIDYTEYSGFAFGMGIERIAMLRYGIDDIRLFYGNDVRFLKQFV